MPMLRYINLGYIPSFLYRAQPCTMHPWFVLCTRSRQAFNYFFSYGYPSSYAPPGTATYSGGGGGYEDNSDDYYVDEEVDAPWNREYDQDDEDQVGTE